MIAQNIANGTARIDDPIPEVSLFNFHYASPPRVVAENARPEQGDRRRRDGVPGHRRPPLPHRGVGLPAGRRERLQQPRLLVHRRPRGRHRPGRGPHAGRRRAGLAEPARDPQTVPRGFRLPEDGARPVGDRRRGAGGRLGLRAGRARPRIRDLRGRRKPRRAWPRTSPPAAIGPSGSTRAPGRSPGPWTSTTAAAAPRWGRPSIPRTSRCGSWPALDRRSRSEMTFIPSTRRRFLQASLAAAGARHRAGRPFVARRRARRRCRAVRHGERDDPAGQAGGPRRSSSRARPTWRTGWSSTPTQPRLRVVRLRPASRPRRRGLRQGDRGGRLGRGAGRPARRDVDDALRDRRGRTPRVPRRLPRLGRDRHLPEHRRGGERPARGCSKRLARFTYTTDLLRDQLFKAVRPDDVVAAKKAGKLCLAFTTNGVPLDPALGERARRVAGHPPVPPARGADDAPDLQPPQPPGRRGGRAERRRPERLRPPGDRRDEPRWA